MTHLPPPAEELRLLDAELRQLDARRAQLLARRAWLVAALHAAAPRPVPAAAPLAWRPEASAPRVQNVLLLLGGVLLTIAAMAFTLVSWGHLGIAGRAAVLGTVTAGVLAAPVPLLRRGLRSTAESVAGLGLALTVLDAYALHEAALGDLDGTAYAAVAAALLAAAWAAYGTGLKDLRLPHPAALGAAQLPLLLTALAFDADEYGIAVALLATAAADAARALRVSAGSGRAVRAVAVTGAYGMGGWGVLAAVWLSWSATGPSAAARASALLVLASAIAVGAAWRTATAAEAGTSSAPDSSRAPLVATGTALLGGLLLVVALGGVLRVSLPDGWAVPAHLLCAVALSAAVLLRVPEAVRQGLLWASGAVQALSLLCALPLVAVVGAGPLGWVERPWSGGPADAREAVTVHTPWLSYAPQALLVLVVVAGVLALLVREAAWRPRALTGAAALAWAAALAVPAVLELPYAVGLLLLGLVTAAALAVDGRLPHPPTGTVLALLASLDLAFLALADRSATLVALSALTVLFAAASAWTRFSPVTAPAALAYATALACATGAAADWEPQHTALLVLAVPAAAALLAARVGGATGLAIEIAGAVSGAVAVGLALTDAPMLALVLALLGVMAAGTAARPDRRPVGYAAAALFVLSTWVRLAAWEVDTPEAYTLPVTVPALLLGVWRRRRDPQASSWTAYGPGLAATMLPSLVAVWADPYWTRPLLLGLAALAVTLLGARSRLQAPLVLGGTTLALVTLHELAPHIAQLVGALPRWVPPALAGLLLLAVGATYERRLKDVRRARKILGDMV